MSTQISNYPKRLKCEGTPLGDSYNKLALRTIGERRWNVMKYDGRMRMCDVPDEHIPIIELLADQLESYVPMEEKEKMEHPSKLNK